MTNPGSCRTEPVQMDESVHGSIVEREMSVNAGMQLDIILKNTID